MKPDETIPAPGMLLIGSTSRNAGKTEFSTRILRQFVKSHDIIAVKVTAIDCADGACPRGGKGCGVCSSLKGNYMLTEETDASGSKDTSRLLDAGASRVLWLRVLKSKMREGFEKLLGDIGRNTAWLCESNSIRQTVRPDVFLMVSGRGENFSKESSIKVREFADKEVFSDPVAKTFDFNFDRLEITGGHWALKENATAIILAGGKSSRMGTNKSLLTLGGQTIIEHIIGQISMHFDETIISTDSLNKYQFLNIPLVADTELDRGPLMGLASALVASKHELNFITACDFPDINMPFVRRMLRETEGFDAVVPRGPDGKIEPLHAVYRRNLAPLAMKILSAGEGKIRILLNKCRTNYIAIPAGIDFTNINTRNEYNKYMEWNIGIKK